MIVLQVSEIVHNKNALKHNIEKKTKLKKKNDRNNIVKNYLILWNFVDFTLLKLRKSFLDQSIYVQKFGLLEQSFLNQDVLCVMYLI